MVLGYAELVRALVAGQPGQAPEPHPLQPRRVSLERRRAGPSPRLRDLGEVARGGARLTFTPTPCDYWIFQLCNIWQENLDCYEDGQGYVTKYGARYEADGSVRVVVSDSDPGIGGNWIDPCGHAHGGMSLRLIKTQGEPPPVALHRLPLVSLARDGWAALAPAEAIVSGEISD